MRNYFFRIKFRLLFLLLLFAGSGIHAQVYPVQVTVVPTPPHRNYLNSFSEQGALNVFLTLTDFNSGPISVKLKMELNGPGYQFRSLPNNLIYVLNPGQPVQVPMEDLAVFFSSTGQTLNFNPGKLPEGNTSICIDVIKNQSGEVLSQNGCGYFYMGYGQPASLLQPACNATVQIPAGYPASTDLRTLPLQFNFIPALAPIGLQQEVENTLYIYNWLGTVNTNPPLTPNGLALAMDPVELGPITAHTLLPINNQLIVGQEYVWYVKTSLNGSTNQFQNGGWSAPCKFKYGAAQSIEEALANGLSVEWVDLVSNSESKGTGTWKVVKEDPNSSATFNQFILKYRRKVPAGQQPFEWFSDTVNDLSKAIYQLEPATTYEASVAGRLGSFVSEPTEIRTFTTAPPRTYSCGVANFPGRATAFQPLEYADPGMKVKIGMFQLEFVSVQNTGQPGHFSGTGLIPVDFLFGAEARVKFDNLKIDKEYDVWEGTAHVITDGLDAWLEDQYQQFQDPIFVNGTVDSAYVSDSIAHVVIDGIDTTFTFPCATCPVIINDVAGNQVTIYPNGTVIWSSYLDVSDEQLDVPDTEIGVFEQHAQETGGFDPFEHIEWNANYEIIRTSNAVNYFVANKSLIKGQPDKVSLSVPENKYTATNVQLSWAGLATPLAPASSTVSSGKRVFVFDLPAFNDDDEFAIYAISDNLKIGKLNVVVYELIQKNIVVIPIGGTIDGSQLRTYLNTTLGESGIDFTITISDTTGVGKYSSLSSLNIPDATLMSKYSGKMRQIRNSYFDTHEEEDNSFYFFIVSSLMDTVHNLPVDGYMVRGKNIGFIQSGSTFRTYAHELGHGAGFLEHSWKNNGPERGSSNNLMDYVSDDNLLFSQWEELRNPNGTGLWDEEEDNESDVSGNYLKRLLPLKNANNTFTFFDPSGGIISIPVDGLTNICISDNNSYKSFSENTRLNVPAGTLVEFSYNGKRYFSFGTETDFAGYAYKEGDTRVYYEDPYSKEIPESDRQVILGFPYYPDAQEIVNRIPEVNGVVTYSLDNIQFSDLPTYAFRLVKPTSSFSWPSETITYLNKPSKNFDKFASFMEKFDYYDGPLVDIKNFNISWNDYAKGFLVLNSTEFFGYNYNQAIQCANYINSNPGVYISIQACNSVDFPIRNHKQLNTYLYEDELSPIPTDGNFSYWRPINQYSEAQKEHYIDQFKGTLRARTDNATSFNSEIENWPINNPDGLNTKLAGLCEGHYSELSVKARKQIIKTLAQSNDIDECDMGIFSSSTTCSEGQILAVLRNAPATQYKEIVTFLKENDNLYFRRLYKGIDNHTWGAYNFEEFTKLLTAIVTNAFDDYEGLLDNNAVIYYESIAMDNYISMYEQKQRYLGSSLVESDPAGKVWINMHFQYGNGYIPPSELKHQYNPLDVILIYGASEYNYSSQYFKLAAGEMKLVPAFYLAAVNKSGQDRKFEYELNVVTTVAGGIIMLPLAEAQVAAGGIAELCAVTEVIAYSVQAPIIVTDVLNTLDPNSESYYIISKLNDFCTAAMLFSGGAMMISNLDNAANFVKNIDLDKLKNIPSQVSIQFQDKIRKLRDFALALLKKFQRTETLLEMLNGPSLKSLKNNVNGLSEALYTQFLDDFSKSHLEDLKKLQNEGLFEIWKTGVRSSNIEELREVAKIPNLRSEYAQKVKALAQKKIELESQGKTPLEIAQTLFGNRRDLTIHYKKITPDDLMEWIYKRNHFEYVVKGTGDKWGLTWQGALKKYSKDIVEDLSQATPSQMNEIYSKIAGSASEIFEGAEDKIALGQRFLTYFDGKVTPTEFLSLERVLLKYRMM
ncbi:hypothetical protein [uncultured Fluviicola sp.]|uniref:hypothetical protein n=1 Tax=uncultured Fluviicola sp. TaxID=463303 RepID=UPI0025E0FD60|nr:hypothetical protein [uncultured Fluviicola sp.]